VVPIEEEDPEVVRGAAEAPRLLRGEAIVEEGTASAAAEVEEEFRTGDRGIIEKPSSIEGDDIGLSFLVVLEER